MRGGRASPGTSVVLAVAVACACAPEPPIPTEVEAGVHRIAFRVPEGWLHFDHGREQRFERDLLQISIADLGPVSGAGYARVIERARDLLRHGPHRYEDATTVTPIAKLTPGVDATAIGEVVSKGVIPTRRGLRFFQAVIKDATGLIECSWPGQP